MQKSCKHKSCQSFGFRCAVTVGLTIATLSGDGALAQTLLPPPRNMFFPPSALSQHHMTPTGKPCLKFQAFSKAQTINTRIYEHWVSATNTCGQHIKVKVCYYNTQDCIGMDVPPWGQQDSVLGIYPSLSEFRYEAKEQF